jgi:hypothetical protein
MMRTPPADVKAPPRAPRMTPARRPRLRLVSHSLESPRHVVFYDFDQPGDYVVEVITEAELAAMAPAEWPDLDRVAIMPGVGLLLMTPATKQQAADALSLYDQQAAAWKAERGIGG